MDWGDYYTFVLEMSAKDLVSGQYTTLNHARELANVCSACSGILAQSNTDWVSALLTQEHKTKSSLLQSFPPELVIELNKFNTWNQTNALSTILDFRFRKVQLLEQLDSSRLIPSQTIQ